MKKIDVIKFLKSVVGEDIDICYSFLQKIWELSFEEQVQNVHLFYELYGTVESNKTNHVESVISRERLNELKSQYGEYVNNLLKTLLRKAYLNGWDKNQFYSALWRSLTQGDMLASTDEWAFGLYYTLIDRRIPYFQLEVGTKMGQEEFEELLEANKDLIQKNKFVLVFPFEQKTEEASIILNDLEKLEDSKAKVVVLSMILNNLRKERDQAFELVKDILGLK